jgi:glycosyltransferase involved in cell wall biosynthesis
MVKRTEARDVFIEGASERTRLPAGGGKGNRTVGRLCIVVPALDAARTVGDVVRGLVAGVDAPVIVVDDGSADATSDVARAEGATAIRHERNLGKGAAIRTGLREAQRRGFEMAVVVDADGQHPVDSARAVIDGSDDPAALVLGVRDLAASGAPRSNRFGNEVSNFFLSRFAGRRLRDTQCGLRRYPVAATLALRTRSVGYAYEAEVILRAIAAGMPVIEVPILVYYPPREESLSHFRVVMDPTRIVATVVSTALELRFRGR